MPLLDSCARYLPSPCSGGRSGAGRRFRRAGLAGLLHALQLCAERTGLRDCKPPIWIMACEGKSRRRRRCLWRRSARSGHSLQTSDGRMWRRCANESGSGHRRRPARPRYAFLEDTAAATSGATRSRPDTRRMTRWKPSCSTSCAERGWTACAAFPSSAAIYVRPLLQTSRAAVEAYCAEHGLSPRRDPSNLTRRTTRATDSAWNCCRRWRGTTIPPSALPCCASPRRTARDPIFCISRRKPP